MTKEQYQELFSILSPRMRKQLIEYATQLEREQEFLDTHYPNRSHNNPADEPEHGDFTIKGNTLFL